MSTYDRVEAEIARLDPSMRDSSLASVALSLAQHLDEAESKEAASLARALMAALEKLRVYGSRDDGKSFIDGLLTPLGDKQSKQANARN